ncbi:hypothetical protein L1887_00841 [Cichorium endivia]|nr:hypothetical protein L1887_00841 [Cichorium endivia]
MITVNKPTNQMENENWTDLVGIYQDLLQEETINLNEVAQEHYRVQNGGIQNQNQVAIRNSTSIPKPNHDSNPISYFTYEDRNWDGNLLSAIVKPKKTSFINGPQSNGVHDLNRIPILDSTTQVQSNSLLKNQQSTTFTLLGSMINGYNSENLPTDGFPVPYRPCYNLNSPPRSEPDATSSGITGPLPFAPITPDTRQKQTESQWVPAKITQESQGQSQSQSQRNENIDNIVESTSSAVSTTQKELVCEEGDELGIDLNKTPNQKTPARRKKHRPKVIREAKPKKTKTPKDPGNRTPNETPVKRKYVRKKAENVLENPDGNGVEVSPNGARVKRKYVRKKGIENTEVKRTGVEEDTGPVVKTPVKSCKKQLNFDLECVREESQTRESINLNVNPQDIEQETRINSVLERSAMNVAQNNLNGPGTPMAKTRDHALNVLARNLTMRNGYKNQVGQSQSQTVNFDEQRGMKRQFFEQINPRNLNAMDSLVMYQKLLLGGNVCVDRGQDLTSVLLESHKKTKTQNDFSAPEDNSQTYRNVPAMQLLMSCNQRVNPNYHMRNGGGGNVNGGHFRPSMAAVTQNLQKHPEPSGISQRLIQGHRVNPVTAMVSWNRPPASPPKDYFRSEVVTYPVPLLDKKRTPTPNSSTQKSNLEVHQQSTKPKPRGGPRKQKVTVEDITCKLEGLCICDENEKMRNAIVPYKGDNVIVPFEPIKKRKPRPKVDLDPETDRLWRLLMGKEGSEANETLDKDKEKWWENERKVFRGRADSFIARMHLVQGDRRFSRWKGSVVDSVIGVFLTQNVSDHLSSSAFMSLAARFSFKSTSTNETRCQNGTCVLVEEPIETVLPTDRTPESVILSQDSLDSFIIQTVDEIRSSSGSNSEVEDQITGPTNPIQPEKVSMFTEFFNMTTPLNRSQYLHEIPKTPPSGFGLLGESVASLASGYHTSNISYQQNEANSKEQNYTSHERLNTAATKISRERKAAIEDEKKKTFDWDSLRRDVLLKCEKKERSKDAKDSLDYQALRNAHVNQISDAIRERGMNNLLADRIKDFLDRLVRDHGSIDLEWLRDVPPDKAKDYLLSIRGLGLKSVECVRLLTLHHLAFPVDTNVGRIAVRLGWVPLQPLPESLQLHLLEMYPVLESIQKYLWPRLCKLDQLTLYELHYQMITFGKVFCTKSKPNCNACPMRAECRHFASAFASARLALPGPEEKKIVPSVPNATNTNTIPPPFTMPMSLPPSENSHYNTNTQFSTRNCEPIIEEPTTPEPETAELSLSDIEDQYYDDHDDDDEIPTIKLDMNEFSMNLQKMQESMDIQGDMSQALVALNPQAASIPTPKLKNVSRLRTEHQVYELPDSHPILEGLDRREPDDPSPYLLAIWTPGETANSMQPPERGCQGQETGILCDRTTCFSCNCIKEANSQVVRGTILMPCRTATRGSFPLNGTYFQVNEMFADHSSSLKPIEVPRAWIWNLPRRTVYFGTSVSTIFKGLTTQEIQQCFWRGFVCVRGFDQKTRAPRPLMARLHFPASRLVNKKNEDK